MIKQFAQLTCKLYVKSHRALDCMQRKRQTRKFHPLEKHIKLRAKRESPFFQNRRNNLLSFDFISFVTGRAWKLREIPRENQVLNRFVIAIRRISRWANRVWWEKRIKKKEKLDFEIHRISQLHVREIYSRCSAFEQSPQPSISGLTRDLPRYIRSLQYLQRSQSMLLLRSSSRNGRHFSQFVVIAVKPLGSRIFSNLPEARKMLVRNWKKNFASTWKIEKEYEEKQVTIK